MLLGKLSRAGDLHDDYRFGDLLRGVFTSATDPATQAAAHASMVKAGRKMLLQQRLAMAKMAHPRLSSEVILAVGRLSGRTPEIQMIKEFDSDAAQHNIASLIRHAKCIKRRPNDSAAR